MKITFYRPKPRIEDWTVRGDGIAYGSLWRAGAEYCVSSVIALRSQVVKKKHDASF